MKTVTRVVKGWAAHKYTKKEMREWLQDLMSKHAWTREEAKNIIADQYPEDQPYYDEPKRTILTITYSVEE